MTQFFKMIYFSSSNSQRSHVYINIRRSTFNKNQHFHRNMGCLSLITTNTDQWNPGGDGWGECSCRGHEICVLPAPPARQPVRTDSCWCWRPPSGLLPSHHSYLMRTSQTIELVGIGSKVIKGYIIISLWSV